MIETLDNPGWRVEIDLNGTRYAELQNAELNENFDDESNWMTCKIDGGVFKGRGGPLMLGPIIQLFRKWIESL